MVKSARYDFHIFIQIIDVAKEGEEAADQGAIALGVAKRSSLCLKIEE